MSYFKKVKTDDEVFGLVFGKGKVRTVLNGFYLFEVQYLNGHVVPYTEDGIPGWSNFDFQTVFNKEDIDITTLDISPAEKILGAKKIIKLREKGKLEAKCPSGVWINVKECPGYLIEQYLEEAKLFLFRKAK